MAAGLASGAALAQPTVTATTDLAALLSIDPTGPSDDLADFGGMSGPVDLFSGASIRESVSIAPSQLPGAITASADVTISPPTNIRSVSPVTGIGAYDIIVSGVLDRSVPDSGLTPLSFGRSSFELAFAVGNPLFDAVPIGITGDVSHNSTASVLLGPTPPFELLLRDLDAQVDTPLFELFEASEGTVSDAIALGTDELGTGINSELLLRVASDSDRLGGIAGNSSVAFDITITFFGQIPAPSSAAVLGLAGLAAARRRR